MFLVWPEEYMTYHSTCLSVAKQSIGAPGQLLLLFVSDWVCKSKHWALPNSLIAGICTLSSSLWWSRLSIHSVEQTTYWKRLARIDSHKRKKIRCQSSVFLQQHSWETNTVWCETWKLKNQNFGAKKVNSQKLRGGASKYNVVKRAGFYQIIEER
jgi:hypothetical protein